MKSFVVHDELDFGGCDHRFEFGNVFERNVRIRNEDNNVVENLVVVSEMQQTHGLFQEFPLMWTVDFCDNGNVVVSFEIVVVVVVR